MMESQLLFSDTIACSIISWSPDGIFLAHDSRAPITTSKQNPSEIIIRDVKSELGFFKAFHYKGSINSSKVDCLSWSLDSCYLAIGLFEVGHVHIFCLDSAAFKCKIDVGNEFDGVGLIDFCWSPRSRHVLTTAADYIQLTIWPLTSPATSRNVLHVRNVLPTKNHKAFTDDGHKLALAQHDVDLDGQPITDKDKIITIYNTSNWKPEIVFPIKVKDLIGIKWSPDTSSQVLLVWDSLLFSNLYLYSSSGSLIKHISPDGLAPGIKTIQWSPTGQLLVFSNHNNVVRILNGLSYGTLLEEKIGLDMPTLGKDCVIYKEEVDQESSNSQEQCNYKYSMCKKLHKSMVDQKNSLKPKLKSDVLKFSWDGQYLATYLHSYANILWIWHLPNLKISSVLVQKQTISDFQWHPQEHRLCICTSTDYIYSWSPTGSYVSRIPDDDFTAQSLEWNPNESRFVVLSKDRMSCCRFNET